jgi:hypothetical protein
LRTNNDCPLDAAADVAGVEDSIGNERLRLIIFFLKPIMMLFKKAPIGFNKKNYFKKGKFKIFLKSLLQKYIQKSL